MQKVTADALRLLRFRPRSVKEMAQRLKQKGHRGFMIAQVIDYLKEKKLLDDRIFSRLWIGDRMNIKPSGRNLITRELKAKGVDDETINAAFAEFEGSFDEYEIAMPLVPVVEMVPASWVTSVFVAVMVIPAPPDALPVKMFSETNTLSSPIMVMVPVPEETTPPALISTSSVVPALESDWRRILPAPLAVTGWFTANTSVSVTTVI